MYDEEIVEHLKDFLAHAFLFKTLSLIVGKQNNVFTCIEHLEVLKHVMNIFYPNRVGSVDFG